jgi:succinyl-CoA synthetase beta subunit
MKLYEFEGKKLLSQFGINVPKGALATTAEAAKDAAAKLGGPVFVKAQVLAGGRGKGGGVLQAPTALDAQKAAQALLGSTLLGHLVRQVLVEERVAHQMEFYLSFFVDFSSEKLWWLFSPRGGVDVERIGTCQLVRLPVTRSQGVDREAVRQSLESVGLGRHLPVLLATVEALYQCICEGDLLLAEINPLLLREDGEVVAADARIEVDDNALFRNRWFDLNASRERLESESEREAMRVGLNGFVALEGEAGIVASGAGLGMATMDLLQAAGLRPANFLETGGRITKELIVAALELVLKQPGLKGVLVNLYGGINPMVPAAEGVAEVLKTRRPTIPIVVKLLGNEQERAWELLEAAGVPTVKDIRTERAVACLAKRVREGT